MELTTTRWDVQLLLSEQDGTTHAEARLLNGLTRNLTARGIARLAPDDPQDVPEVGYELAAARALVSLGEQLLRTAEDDVDALNRGGHELLLLPGPDASVDTPSRALPAHELPGTGVR